MEQNVIQKNMWNTAGKAGLFLGLTSTAFLFISQLLGQVEIPVFLNSILSFILWTAKFIGCIWIMKFFMKQFAAENKEATNLVLPFWNWGIFYEKLIHSILVGTYQSEGNAENKALNYWWGMSAGVIDLVYSAFAFANVAFISPDLFTEQMDAMMQQMAPMMDSNTMSVMETYMENLAQITFFSNLIYCFLYGTVLSFILSRNIPSKDPFAEYKPEQ